MSKKGYIIPLMIGWIEEIRGFHRGSEASRILSMHGKTFHPCLHICGEEPLYDLLVENIPLQKWGEMEDDDE